MENNKLYEMVLDQFSDAVMMFNKDQKIIYCNKNFLEMVDFSQEEVQDKIIQVLYPKFKNTGLFVVFLNLLKSNGARNHLCEIDNRIFLVKISSTENGIISFFRDITKQRKIEKLMHKTVDELAISQDYTKNLLDSSLDMIISVNNDRKVITFNKAAQETFGYLESEVLGKHVKMLYGSQKESLAIHREVLRIGKTDKEVLNRRKNGEVFVSRLSTAVIYDSSRKRIGVMGISRDISAIKEVEAEVVSLKSKLSEKFEISKSIGSSQAIKRVLDQLYMVAPTNMTVLLQGESGTGKELFSSLTHQHSRREKKPYLALDCGAIPDTLIESELFGYEKGAFTGADSRKPGVFERANGGTLLLDEITNLNPAAQAKLLRVLQERTFTRVGGTKAISFDVRIIAASNVRVADAVKSGDFRLDLYHRMNEFQIDLPLLCERLDDIPTLLEYFLKSANAELNKNISGIHPHAMKRLLSYSWPGNIREFRNIVRRAVLLCSEDTIRCEHLIIDDFSNNISVSNIEKIESGEGLKDITLAISKEIEKELISYALNKFKGNKTKTAKFLQIERMTLYLKLKEYDFAINY